jgi:small subunit ribosomal protein S4
VKEAIEVTNFIPDFVTFDADKLEGTFTRLPERSELPPEINETLIVEFYSR